MKHLKKVNEFFIQYAYLIFLCTLVAWIGFLPLLEITGFARDVEFLLFNLIFLSSYYFFHVAKKKRMTSWLIPTVFLLCLLNYFLPGLPFTGLAYHAGMFVLLLLITVHFIVTIFKSKHVNLEVIYISIAGYILIGLMSSILCWLTNNLYPNAYNIPFAEDRPVFDFAYYAFVTLVTLGYGDIVPLIPQSKSLAIFIALVGQLYMTVLMALLIGKFLKDKE